MELLTDILSFVLGISETCDEKTLCGFDPPQSDQNIDAFLPAPSQFLYGESDGSMKYPVLRRSIVIATAAQEATQ